MTDFYDKYLKYKKKYLVLKKQLVSNELDEEEPIYPPSNNFNIPFNFVQEIVHENIGGMDLEE
jgi:hypothetical protein